MKEARCAAARARLDQLLSGHPLTEGMYVRTWGDHLIIGREEHFGPNGETEADDRLRITALKGSSFGLSVRRHTGRWEKTPFTGTLEELVDIIGSMMQHIVAPYS
ncbi:MAG: hypothetical protein O2894_14135 [Planctomycetota bacterium]|nr:hypothetical protein [Planctomycetota bacterium]